MKVKIENQITIWILIIIQIIIIFIIIIQIIGINSITTTLITKAKMITKAIDIIK